MPNKKKLVGVMTNELEMAMLEDLKLKWSYDSIPETYRFALRQMYEKNFPKRSPDGTHVQAHYLKNQE